MPGIGTAEFGVCANCGGTVTDEAALDALREAAFQVFDDGSDMVVAARQGCIVRIDLVSIVRVLGENPEAREAVEVIETAFASDVLSAPKRGPSADVRILLFRHSALHTLKR